MIELDDSAHKVSSQKGSDKGKKPVGGPSVSKVDLRVTDFIMSRSTTTHLSRQTRLPLVIKVVRDMNNQALTEGLL